MSKLGWCTGPVGSSCDHDACPGQIGQSGGIITCDCDCGHSGRGKS